MRRVRRSSRSWTATVSRATRRAVTRSSPTSPRSNTEPDVSTERRGTSKRPTTSRREAGVDVLGEILPVQAAVACSWGNLEEASRYATEGLAVCERTADLWNEIRCRSVLGFMEISREDPVAAHRWLGPLPALTEQMGLREPGAFPFVPDAVEALVALGELDRAEELTERLEDQGIALGRPLAIGTAARCRGLIAATRGDLPGAAIVVGTFARRYLRRVPHPFETARTLLLSGEVQRRMKKKSSAREMIGGSIEVLDAIGARLWADKARRALARIGGRPPSPSDSVRARNRSRSWSPTAGRTERSLLRCS